jgi:hypothetical protein
MQNPELNYLGSMISPTLAENGASAEMKNQAG